MIEYQEKYKQFIIGKGVGSNDKVANSVKSYISYLNSVSKYLAIKISPQTLRTTNDIKSLSDQLTGLVSQKTIKNYGSAMKQYVSMVRELGLPIS